MRNVSSAGHSPPRSYHTDRRVRDGIARLEARWYAAAVQTGREEFVAAKLKAVPIATYIPKLTVWAPRSRHDRRMERRASPLLRGYVFADVPAGCTLQFERFSQIEEIDRKKGGSVRISTTHQALGMLDVVERTEGVRGIVHQGDGLLQIPSAAIADLRDREASGTFDMTRRHRLGRGRLCMLPEWAVEFVHARAKRGAWEGHGGVIEKIAGSIATLGVMVFGRLTPVEIDVADLELA